MTIVPESGHNFTSTLSCFDNNLWYYHIEVPTFIASNYIIENDRRIVCTLNHTEKFQAALMHSGSGGFFVNVNKNLRVRLNLKLGDTVQVYLQKDTSDYGLPMPIEFAELLLQDETGNDIFHSLTMGKQRTLLFIIAKPKSTDLRIRNGIAVLNHLNYTNGKINFKQLNQDIKNTF